ncbi:hypothetical protein MA16_Dca001408 [Dendrobium catenatum]|uniref:Integrase catalytic domain-containing protein n=1 Tax=Dendrobium catenatum TaxID=906689 RepID=A0A2I0WMB5_9ASPA|nr:hypothetical protein MA16_Dca001408 [Dendrobium catenatum]
MREMVHSYADLIHRVEAQINADKAINAHRKQFEQATRKRKRIRTICGDQQVAQLCYLKQAQPRSSVTLSIEDFDLRNEDTPQRASPVEDPVDYFIKWVEAETLAKITEANAKQFLWKRTICRFDIHAKVITDNGTQFTGRVFTTFYKDLHIHLVHTAVAHPQTNGQTEVTNRTILRGLKTRLEKAGGQWDDELPNILWAYRTTARTPTGETPYNLCFEIEAVIPVDIGVPNHRVQTFDSNANDEKLRHNLDLLPEVRDGIILKVAAYHQRVARHYNIRIKPRHISIGDLVLRSIEVEGKGLQRNKLSPLWEGTYLVAAMVKPGTFKLKDANGKMLPQTWSIENLRK